MTTHIDPFHWVAAGAQAHGDRSFLVTPGGRRVSYRELYDETARVAAALAALGVAAGDRVVLQVDKSVEAILVYLACLRMGAVLVPLNTAYTAAELDYFLSDAQPRLAVIRPADRGALEPLAQRAGVAQIATLAADGAGSLFDARLPRVSIAPLDRPVVPDV